MDEELNAEERVNRWLEEKIKIDLQELEVNSASGSGNVSMSFLHTHLESLETSSLFNAVPQETLTGIPTVSTPAFTGQGEMWNIPEQSEQSDMDEELNAEERENQRLEALIHIQLQKQQIYSDSDSGNVSMPLTHTLPRERFPTSSLYNAVPQETVIGMPNFSTPAFTGHGEIFNTPQQSEQSGMIRMFSNFERNQPQGLDLFEQNWSSSVLPAFDTFFNSDQTASGRFPAVPSTSERFHVNPNVSVVHETISDPNVYHSYHSNASNSELEDNCQGYFEHPDFRNSPQCQITTDIVEECFQNMTSGCSHDYTEERTFLGINDSVGLWLNSRGHIDPPSGNVFFDNQNPASQKNLDIPETCSISNIGRGEENPKHVLKDELNRPRKEKHGSKESLHFTCDYCSRRFLRFWNLKRHIRVHTGDKPFQCKVCYKVFAERHNLTKHERVHTGERAYVCEVCRKGFALISNLRVHQRTHTLEKPFVCKVCNRGFARKSHLRRHERTHTREKPFPCLVCNLRFADKRNLQTHERTHEPFKCERCPQSFTSEIDLRFHETTDHFE